MNSKKIKKHFASFCILFILCLLGAGSTESFITEFIVVPVLAGILMATVFIVFQCLKDGAAKKNEQERLTFLSPEEREEHALCSIYGGLRPRVICPHCQTNGHVRTRLIIMTNNTVSNAKVKGAILTGGLSVLATGISSEKISGSKTRAHCSNCESTWDF